MRGWFYSSDNRLSDHDIQELADALAVQLYNLLGERVFLLQRIDVAELIEQYVNDLDVEDQKTMSWIVWSLFQDARQIILQDKR
jgi:hypothetical protein